ncbi:MAG: KR domain-containing protein [Rhodospirillales bacterium]|nr:KR domain-containing protein [Rhodospirillales bacterium]
MIALIGMAGRFPGAPDVAAYWDLLANGREGLSRLGEDELLAAGVAPETLADPRYVPAAAALDGIDRFDAGFWEIGAHEAALMDPQQRLLLDLAWHALEDAAIDPRRVEGSVGVFVAGAISTYLLFQLREAISGPSAPSQLLAMMGNDKDYLATQLAYRIGLTGPAVSVQTACSSSLVAVHLACQSLLSGECDVAIAGGVSVRVPHRVGYLYEAGGMLSPDGHCRSFADDAAGTVFGSGGGLVVLRRAEDAGRDRIRALVLGSATNNDGRRKVGFTAPSQDGQAAVIAEALAVAGCRPGDLGAIEAHGTGTPLGDPVEVAALAAALRGAPTGSIALGSAKSNVGHLETAAGVAGLIKAVCMLERTTIVTTLHASVPSARIPWADTPLTLAREVRPWTERRVAGVSSFGIGGTNAHVVLGAAPAQSGRLTAPRLVISARDPAALDALAAAYRDRLAADPDAFPALAGAATRRPHLPHWLAADSPAALMTAAPRQGEPPEIVPDGEGPPVDLPLYPFQRRRHWIDPPTPLLGALVETPSGATVRPVELPPARLALLRQHRVDGAALLPAALHLAAFAASGPVADVAIERPLPLDGTPILQLWEEAQDLRIMARHQSTWSRLASARRAEITPSLVPWAIEGQDVPVETWTAAMADAGLTFGPNFRPLRALRVGAGQAAGEVAAGDPIVAVDAGLQAIGAAVAFSHAGGAAPCASGTPTRAPGAPAGAAPALGFRPASIGRFAATGELGRTRTVLARISVDTPDAKTGDVLWLDAAGTVLAEARDVVCRRIRPAIDAMLHRLAWLPDADPALTAPHAALERAACAFARDALAAIDGPERSPPGALARVPLATPARPAIATLLRPHAAAADPELRDPAALCRELAARHPDHAAEIDLVARCGAALPSVLDGTRDPLELLFGGEGAHGAYRASPLAAHLNAIAAAVARGARPARVIEIGGGTGATTSALHPALPARSDYLFTDLSPAFLAAAEQRFGVRTAPLDIMRDPAAQGIETGAWDLVVAANVLHATPDLARAVRHAVGLLAPGGRLLLVEGTAALARLDITFGLTEAWTRQDDRALRPCHPLIDAAAWHRLLAEAGLADIVTVAELGGQAVLTARAGAPRWVAVGRTPAACAADLPLLPPEAPLPDRLDGVVCLAGWEADEAGGPNSGGGTPDPDGALLELLALARRLIARQDAPRLLLPLPDPASPERAALGGFLRTLGREHPELRPRSVALDGAPATALAVERALDDGEDRVLWRGPDRLHARLVPLADGEDRAAAPAGDAPPPRTSGTGAARPGADDRTGCRVGHDGAVVPLDPPVPGPGDVLLRVRAAGLNYKDALTVAGQVPPAGPGLGGEAAGEVIAVGPGVTGVSVGQAVVAVGAGALATHLCADARLVLPKPPALGYAQAAAIPIAGTTAWHALHHLARVRPGQRVLVHAGTGGVGWFAVRLAQAAGATVVATAGTPEKRARLAAIGVAEVYSSRDDGFAAAAPVDIVLGALPPALRAAAVRLLRPGGTYVEIGRIGVPATAPRPDIAWHVVALDRVEAPVFAAILREVLDAVAADPSLLPPIRSVPLTGTEAALGAMMRAAHVGKLVALPALPAAIRGDSSYLVTGGLGGLGPDIAAWLARRGAGGVVRLARRPRRDVVPSDVVIGDVVPVDVVPGDVVPSDVVIGDVVPGDVVIGDVVIGDVTDPAALAAVDAHLAARGLPPLRGVIHAAGVLEDATIATLDPGSFARVAAPKCDGLRAIQARWPDLELLVGFSSAGALFGSAGQAAHTAASAALDAALAEAAAAGRPAVAIDWGAWRERGAAADRGTTAALLAGMGTIGIRDGFAALDRVLQSGMPHAAVLPVDRPAMRAAGTLPRLLETAAGEAIPLRPDMGADPDIAAHASGTAAAGETDATPSGGAAAGATSPAAAAEAMPEEERRRWLQARIAAECAAMLALPGAIDPRRPLQELGLDSLAALELRNRLGRVVGAVLPASLLFDHPTVAALTAHLGAAHFGLHEDQAEAAAPVRTGPAPGIVSEALDTASDADLDAALAAFAALHGEDA